MTLCHTWLTSFSSGRTGAKQSMWWADNYPGQNKNNVVTQFQKRQRVSLNLLGVTFHSNTEASTLSYVQQRKDLMVNYKQY